MSPNYKIINLPLKNPLTEDEHRAISYLLKINNEKDFDIEIKEDELKVLLKKIDINEIKQIITDHNLEKGNILEKMLEEIKNIKSYGVSNKKRVYIDYNEERKVQNRKEKEAERQKYYYARDHSFSKKNNELPQKYIDRIICADSEKKLKELPDNSIDLIFTSPPYNFGLNYENHKDHSYWEIYFDKLFSVFKECIRILKYSGRIIVNVQPLFSDYIPSHHFISNFFTKNKLIWKGEILWEKNNYNCKYTAWGSWKSPSSPYLKYTWEFLEVFTKGSRKKPGNKEDIDITAEEFKDWVTARWSIAPEKNMKEYNHPAMFPEELAKRVLKLFSYENDIILDPFNGVGTTTYVAKSHNRKYLGIDISKEYCQIARDRMKNIQQKLF